MTRQRRHCVVAWLVLIAAPVTATLAAPADEAVAALQRCRQIADSLQRMVCYDAIVLPQAPSSGLPAATQAAPQSAGARPAAVVAAPTAKDEAATFGLPARRIESAPEQLESAIAGAFDGWQAQTRIRLSNGQLWQVTDGSEGAYRLRDPKVKITRGPFGSYFMEIEGVKQTPKVRRVE